MKQSMLCIVLIVAVASIMVVESLQDSCCITVFENAYFGGGSEEICGCSGCHDLHGYLVNKVSSIKSNLSVNVLLYSEENCSGAEFNLGVGSNNWLSKFNDKTKSIKIGNDWIE